MSAVVPGYKPEGLVLKNYMSFGGGVNSVALYLLLLDQGVEFEAVYVDHGADWPETTEYVKEFQKLYPLTMLTPNVQGSTSLLAHCEKYRMIPSRMQRWCTEKFKVMVLHKYYETPCFVMMGIDAGESHRARFGTNKGVENRYPLIEEGIDREGCKKIIKAHGLPVPMKSGCWFCPFQRIGQWRKLRREHPDLFCKAMKLEKAQNEARKENGKGPFNLIRENLPLSKLVSVAEEKQRVLPGLEEIEYPPCQCGL